MEECTLPTISELACCAAILRRMKPADLQLDALHEVRAEGIALFKRYILKEAFGSGSAVEFLKQKTQVNQKIVEMRRLEKAVTLAHGPLRKQAETCGMNSARKATLAQIKLECMQPIESENASSGLIMMNQPAATTDSDTRTDVDLLSNAESHATIDDASDSTAVMGNSSEAAEQALLRGRRSAANVAAASTPAEDDADRLQQKAPKDDFYSQCNQCRGAYTGKPHHFYHQLCPLCASHNWEKRGQTADLTGFVLHCAVLSNTNAQIR